MARVTQEHRDARRRQILDAAAQQFGAKGIEPTAATIDDIARAADLSKGSIYSYFENKEELLAAILDRAIEGDTTMFADVTEYTANSWDAFWEVCRRVWGGMGDPARREANMLSFERLLVELRHGDVDPRPVEGPVGALAELLEGAQREGKVAADLDATTLATMLWNCQQGTRAYILRTGDTEMADAELEMMRELVVRSVGVVAAESDAGSAARR